MRYQTTAAAWVAGVCQVPGDSWQVLINSAAGRGGLFTAEKAELFMRRNHSEFARRTGAWRDVAAEFDVGHVRSRAANPQYANQVKNHVYETASSNRSHGAADMPKEYWAKQARVVGRAKFKSAAGRCAQAGVKAGGIAALFELPFAACESYLDHRDGKRTKSEAVKDGAKKVGIAGVCGVVAGAAGFAVAGFVSAPVLAVVSVPLVGVGLFTSGDRAWKIATRFRKPSIKQLNPWAQDQQSAISSRPAQSAQFTVTGMGIPSINFPSFKSITTHSPK